MPGVVRKKKRGQGPVVQMDKREAKGMRDVRGWPVLQVLCSMCGR